MTKKRTDGGHEIPEEDLREMEQEEGREMPDGVESQTGYCRFLRPSQNGSYIDRVEPGRCGRSRDVQVRV